MLTHKGGFYLSLLMVLALTLVLVNRAEWQYRDQLSAERMSSTLERLSIYRYQLESELNTNLSLITGVAAFVAAYPDFSDADFQRYGASVRERQPALVNIAVAPDLVIRHVHPREGNEEAIGLNYRQQEDQWPAVERVIESGTMVIAGPVDLVQGGRAFVARAPVFVWDDVGDQRIWGLVSAPILVEQLFRPAGLYDLPDDLDLAIRGQDATGAEGETFFGEPSVFADANMVSMPVALGEGSWELGVVPQEPGTTAGIIGIRGAGATISVLLMGGLWLRRRFLLEREGLRQIIFRNENFLRAVERVSRVGGWRLAHDGRFTEMSETARRIFDLRDGVDDFSLDGLCALLDTRSATLLRQQLMRALQYRTRFDRELELIRKDGTAVWVHLQGEVFEERGRTEITGAVSDITRSREADRLIEYQANYDGLTHLPNRNLFLDRLHTSLLQARRHSSRLAVLFVDLDDFKSINDNLGHDKGDELLIEAAARIRACVRETDTVSRYSGDEFVALLPDVFSESTVTRICDEIINRMNAAFELDDSRLHCSVSIGVSFFPDDGDEADVLIIKADQAMYEVKGTGKNSWQFYTADMQQESERKHVLYNSLMAALSAGRLQVHYQPVLRVSDRQVVSCEALVRWQSEDGTYISPEEFVRVAEDRGLVSQVDYFVLDTALREIQSVNAGREYPLQVSVNVSPRLFYLRDAHARAWVDLMIGAKVPRSVEITERLLVDDARSAGPLLDELSQSGVEVAIDDFGTGYSGLSYFSRFPIRVLKIDRAFVSKIGVSSTEEKLIESMLLIADKLDLKVIAEGVETEEQEAFLVAAGCEYLQGYRIAPPMPMAELQRFVESTLLR